MFFERFDFLEKGLSLSSNNEICKENLDFFKELSVVNKSAERASVLIEDNNNYLTKNKELQYLL